MPDEKACDFIPSESDLSKEILSGLSAVDNSIRTCLQNPDYKISNNNYIDIFLRVNWWIICKMMNLFDFCIIILKSSTAYASESLCKICGMNEPSSSRLETFVIWFCRKEPISFIENTEGAWKFIFSIFAIKSRINFFEGWSRNLNSICFSLGKIFSKHSTFFSLFLYWSLPRR